MPTAAAIRLADVAVRDVAQLVREHAAELTLVGICRMPFVTATFALDGFRPVANAFGCIMSDT